MIYDGCSQTRELWFIDFNHVHVCCIHHAVYYGVPLYMYIRACLHCRLTIHDGKAKMTFFREFILRLDSSSETEGVFRLSTAGSGISSIMTNPQSPSRPSTTLSLPRIVTVLILVTSHSSNPLSYNVHVHVPLDTYNYAYNAYSGTSLIRTPF